MNSPIFVALDVDSDQEALRIAHEVAPYVGGFKLGPRLCLRYGSHLISSLRQLGRVFIDNKYFDIPNTMVHSVQACFELGAEFVTVHAQCGEKALTQLAGLEKEFNRQRPFRILAVTILTSFSSEDRPLLSSLSITDQVDKLVQASLQCGISSFVCSSVEVSYLKNKYPGVFLVTPGIRFKNAEMNDQKRVMSPDEAIREGADILVVGRPIVEASNPQQEARQFFESVLLRSSSLKEK